MVHKVLWYPTASTIAWVSTTSFQLRTTHLGP